LRFTMVLIIALELASLLLGLGVVQAQEANVNRTLTSIYDNIISGVERSIDKFMTGVQELFIYTIHRGLEVLITIARASYVALGLLGLVLWATGVSPFRGRHLLVGAVVLAIMAEVASGLLG